MEEKEKEKLVIEAGELLIKNVLEYMEKNKEGVDVDEVIAQVSEWIPEELANKIKENQLLDELEKYFVLETPNEVGLVFDVWECENDLIGFWERDYELVSQNGKMICREVEVKKLIEK